MLRLRIYALERKWGTIFRLILLGTELAVLRILIFGSLTVFLRP